MKTVLKVVGILLVALVVLVASGYAWATISSNRKLARNYETHRAEFPIPFPLDTSEIRAMGLTGDQIPEAARRAAIERGRHLVEARYPCLECHGADFGGGVMIDEFPIGTMLGPNLTRGQGSRTPAFTASDWDRAVRHGVLIDGRPSAMPAEDFRRMSDQELSDIVSYILSLPPVDNQVAPRKLGPLGRFLLASGQFPISADLIESHDAAHPVVPPPAMATVDFGEHLAATCSGCHGMGLAGGPIAGAPPGWLPAQNLTRHETGLAAWSLDDFKRSLREGVRPDGSALREPMTLMLPFTKEMSDVELEALWMYLGSLPPRPMAS